MKRIFIDGSAGTTGLRIYERLGSRDDIELFTLPDDKRKDTEARKAALNSADVAFLCLPDDAARQAVAMIENPDTVVIDTSTAHRTNPDFAYGFPELSGEHEDKIRTSKRIAVPGCHASGFIALIYPLIEAGVLDKNTALTCFSITGYSGGGKKMIAEYEAEEINPLYLAPRQYGISQQHKHLPEMKSVTGLSVAPIFCPIVDRFYSGMQVTVPLFANALKNVGIEEVKEIYRKKYNSDIVWFSDNADEEGFLSSKALSESDGMEISVHGNSERMLLVARYDNLGKGASGAAVECLNIVLGTDKNKNLELLKPL